MTARRLLILGGTGEARALASLVVARFRARIEVIASLAGRTHTPLPYEGTTRIGGFGGAAGLAAYLKAERIDAMVDATHPFASAISAHARTAAAQTGVPLIALSRPAWRREPGDLWIVVADAAAAAAALPALGGRVFLSFGGRELDAFAGLDDKWFLVRRLEPSDRALPLKNHEIVLGRPPFTLEHECALLRRHRIDVLVTKASGGNATRAKLDAARALDMPVIVIRRPAMPGVDGVESVEAAVRWVAATLFGEGTIDEAKAVSA